MSNHSKTIVRPRLACEITAQRVVAARTSDRADVVEAYSVRTLPLGSVNPSLTAANLAEVGAVRQAISDVLAAVGGRSRDLTVVLPDSSVRVALLDFDSLPPRKLEADAVVRFRLKKSLPFDVERAALSYDAQPGNGRVRVIAAVALTNVIEEYETLFRDAGYVPGVLVPSTLAALGPVDGSQPTLVIKVDGSTTSVAILDHHELLLFRTIDSGQQAEPSAVQLAEDVYPSIVFFQDTYGARINQVLVAGVGARELAQVLEPTGGRVRELVSDAYLSDAARGSTPTALLAGVVGALLD